MSVERINAETLRLLTRARVLLGGFMMDHSMSAQSAGGGCPCRMCIAGMGLLADTAEHMLMVGGAKRPKTDPLDIQK